jgi:lipid II:glycine glycyltransferase (peptidoglycan interpeptide bridge formation enzyme)
MRHATENPAPKPQNSEGNNFDEFYGENFEKFYKDSSEISIANIDLSKKPKKPTKRSATRDFTSYGCSQKDNNSL